ncbi:syntaxin-binding protein 5 [Lingula anatina]|uniref:Syntaxin-binding protein 5 n=1 Tax=Lingula anatina TaxID=7574 RepID=A0A1S3KH99_LINAN|nr:syntaxin-binding protein 5 [Lingula anatina]|eukprot:XP_013422005.1 syntaxin-binding protein 5 [Lingula anatina]
MFLTNEGALITVCSNDVIHLWNLRQKNPEIVHSLKFQRERITYCHIPFQSKWLYIGTERGNVHIANVESFQLSGYVINWNKAIELSQRTHPGPIVHLSDNPVDAGKLLIGFETGVVVFWDLKSKAAEYRFNNPQALRSITWEQDGKQFMCSLSDGSLVTWNYKKPTEPVSIISPHAKISKDGRPDPCKPINKVEWKSSKNGEPYIIFSGGMSYDRAGKTPCLTVINGKSTTVLEMEHNVVDFISVCTSPWSNDFQDPYAIIVLLQNDLVVVDLTSPGYPCFENPYPMDLHESPVTCCQYYADCPPDLIPAFYSVGSKQQKKSGFSTKEWPVKGGEWGTTTCSYPEIIITGHADGSIKFWDASAVTLQVLYKVKTAKIFDKHHKNKCSENGSGGVGEPEEGPFAIQQLYLEAESRMLVVAGRTHVVLLKYSKQEGVLEVPDEADCFFASRRSLEISIVYEVFDEVEETPEFEFPPIRPSIGLTSQKSGSVGSYSSSASDTAKQYQHQQQQNQTELFTSVKVKGGSRKFSAGYQPTLVCVLGSVEGEKPGNITSISVNSSYGLLAFGNDTGLAIVDYMQKTCLLNMGTPDLYGSMDPYQRVPRSPKTTKSRPNDLQGVQAQNSTTSEDCKSPTSEQINGVCLSPTGTKQKRQHPPELRRTKSQDQGQSSSFSRSRSSSMSSLENVSQEGVRCLVFADSYTRKTDAFTCPCLWVGTSLGSVIVIVLNLPPPGEQRLNQPVIVSPSGTIFRLKGAILAMSFLDCNGILIPAVSEQWRDAGRDEKARSRPQTDRQISLSGNKPRMSPTASTEMCDRQFAIICSEKQARVMSLPSQTCAYKVKVTETSYVAKAEVVAMKGWSLDEDSVCLVCFIASGRLMVFSLPSLRVLMDMDFLSLTDLSQPYSDMAAYEEGLTLMARSFCISNNGHALYMCSPNEVQKVAFSAEITESLNEMLGDLFLPCETPEQPKQGFFKNLFSGGTQTLDREQLFGETSGKAAKGLAKHIPGGMASAQASAASATSEIGRAKMLAMERGEKLGELEMRTAAMMDKAKSYRDSAHALSQHYKDKKWYQF